MAQNLHDIKPLLNGNPKTDNPIHIDLYDKCDQNFRRVRTDLVAAETDINTAEAAIDVLEAAVDILEANIIAPHYDSGWVALAVNTATTLTHNLGGSTDKYIVDFQYKDTTGGGIGVSILGYGQADIGGVRYGYDWRNLTTTQITATRGPADISEQFRIRIWVHA